MNIPFVCWMWTILAIILIAIALTLHFTVLPGQVTAQLSIGCFLAVVLGTVVGLYIYDTASIFPMFYQHARMYTNVVSSEPSAAIADAGKITFNEQTKVDTSKGSGFKAEDGMVYCVAPIMDP